MKRSPSGLSGRLPVREGGDVQSWLARVLVEIDEQSLGLSAPCQNPECGRPVDYGGSGRPPMYCCHTCRSRASTMRQSARQQLEVIEELLEATRYARGVPRDELRERASVLRWWLARLTAHEDT